MLQQFKSKEKAQGAAPNLSSSVTVWTLIFVHLVSDSRFEPRREAPGFDFGYFIKKIMIEILA